ncbi:MAG: putative iron-regulated protein [Planctomycetota bacterium]|jgi:uncharacterized iron-regulated protein
MHRHLRTLSLYLLLLSSCAIVGSDHRMLRSVDGERVDMQTMLDELADADVVFLGEEHDSGVVHRLQFEVTRGLLEHHGKLAVSMEMFERDGQGMLDLYLAGGISEERFLKLTRHWPNYADHYRPVIELAKSEGLPVIAGNCYRPIASKIAKKGLHAGLGSPWAALRVDVSQGAYLDKFMQAMATSRKEGEPVPEHVLRFYASQCVKDSTMAESIALYFDELGEEAAPVVHWCGRFHSDFGLGTVERLRKLRPDLKIIVVSGSKDEDLGSGADASDRERADYLWYVLPE